jgi:hypothetical protein
MGLPDRADEPVRIAAGGLAVVFTERDAAAVPTRPIPGGVAADGAIEGGDLVLLAIDGGIEDLVSFDAAPEREALLYDLRLEGVAGLRLVERSLELLDRDGVPRLRIRAPSVTGADGVDRPAELALAGCDADRDPRAPWGRAVTPPGADRCALEVRWEGVPYPLVVDPQWVDGGAMVVPRNAHAAVTLADGRVLVAGGYDSVVSSTYIRDAELFDPATVTWAVTASMAHGRAKEGMVLLPDGEALAAAGDDQLLPTAERYDPVTALWSATAPMNLGRDGPSSATLPNGGMIVAGGCTRYSATCNIVASDAETYDPATDAWTSTGGMSTPRVLFAMTALADGRVLATGGCVVFGAGFLCNTSTTSVDLFDPATGLWSPAAHLPQPEEGHGAALLASGEVLVGGGTSNGALTHSVARWDPATDSWTAVGSLTHDHNLVPAALLPSGEVLFAGTWGTVANSDDITDDTDVFHPATDLVDAADPLLAGVGDCTVAHLADGRLLFAGGFSQGAGYSLREFGRGQIFDSTCGFVDTDGDGTGDPCDLCPVDATDDSDGDGICDGVDTCEYGDDAADADGDGIADACDLCPDIPDDGADADFDGFGDACEPPTVTDTGSPGATTPEPEPDPDPDPAPAPGPSDDPAPAPDAGCSCGSPTQESPTVVPWVALGLVRRRVRRAPAA